MVNSQFSHIYGWFSYVFPYLSLISLPFPMMFPWFFPLLDARGLNDCHGWLRCQRPCRWSQSRTLQCDNTYVIICKSIWYYYIYILIHCMYTNVYIYIYLYTYIHMTYTHFHWLFTKRGMTTLCFLTKPVVVTRFSSISWQILALQH